MMGASDPTLLAVRAAARGGDVVTQARTIAAQADQIDELDAERTALASARDDAERDASDARADRRDLLATYRDLTEAR